jgi:hypothetical protein
MGLSRRAAGAARAGSNNEPNLPRCFSFHGLLASALRGPAHTATLVPQAAIRELHTVENPQHQRYIMKLKIEICDRFNLIFRSLLALLDDNLKVQVQLNVHLRRLVFVSFYS